jgi:hypothetical protein
MVHGNKCEARRAGTDVSALAGCTPPSPTMFECGWRFCYSNFSYCEVVVSSATGAQYTCKPLPASCGSSPSCECLSGEPCGAMCQGSASTGLTLTCVGP